MRSASVRLCTLAFSVLVTFSRSIAAATYFTPVLPPSYPLAVRSPYLSAWLPSDEVTELSSAVAQFWHGQQLTWSVMARVDGKTYSLFGVPHPGDDTKPASLVSADFSATHTTFTTTANDVNFVLDFFSPVSPHDYGRQSMPFSYLTVSTSSLKSATPSIQIYSDMDNSWVGQFGPEGSMQLAWSWEPGQAGTQTFTLSQSGTATFSEDQDMALWGTSAYCTRENGSKLSNAVGAVDQVRGAFAKDGKLNGAGDFSPGGAFAYSHDLGPLHGTENVTFVIGHVRDPAVNYHGSERSSYWQSVCKDINCGCMHALDDFHAADAEARSLDSFIASTNVAGGNYSNILALSTRQAFGTFELTIPSDSLDQSSVLAFLKEISSNGNVNTMDVIMPMAPIFYVLCPDYLRLLLHPVIYYLHSGAWPNNYTIHDMGSHYPNATGHDDGKAEIMPVEESDNLLALMYMYERASGDKDYKNQFIDTLNTYADYLVENGLHPSKQLSTDDGAGEATNQTGLAVKAAIGLNAYGVMTNQRKYSDAGRHFADVLYKDAGGTDPKRTRFTMLQGKDDSWSLQFNLYLDVLLELNTFPTEAYKMQTDFYPTVRKEAGVPLDSRDSWTKTDWMTFAAATAMAPGVGNEGVRDMFIDDIHAYMTNGLNNVPFSDKFWTESKMGRDGKHHNIGTHDGYRARPVVGGHFALLAMSGPDQWQGSGKK